MSEDREIHEGSLLDLSPEDLCRVLLHYNIDDPMVIDDLINRHRLREELLPFEDPPKRPPRAKHPVDRRELQRREQQEAMQRLKTRLYSSVYQPSDLKAIRSLPQGQDIIFQPASGRGTISIYHDEANHPSQDYAQHVAKDAIDILILADGVGGQGGGEIASHLLGDFVAKNVVAANIAQPTVLFSLLQAADNDLARQPQAGETTAIVIAIKNERLYGVSVGDSEAWLVAPPAHRILTEDQPRKPLVGSARTQPFSFQQSFRAGTLILASDGFFKYTNASEILRCLASMPATPSALALANLARTKQGEWQDDISIIMHTKTA